VTRGVLVTGATGFLGRHLLAALHTARVRTVAHVRDRAAWPYRHEGFDPVAQIEVICWPRPGAARPRPTTSRRSSTPPASSGTPGGRLTR